MMQNLKDFLNYWWFRYLMVTELYMVEKWERITIHIIMVVLFCLFWYFNYSVFLSLTSNVMGFKPKTLGDAVSS